jgi:type II secretory pathway pseudopilin PulG
MGNEQPTEEKKSNLAIWLIVGCGLIVLAIPIMGIIAAIAIPTLLASRLKANETAAIATLRMVNSAQQQFRYTDADGNNRQDYAATISALTEKDLIPPALASGTKSGYIFSIRRGADPQNQWRCTANPLKPGTSGRRYFFIDETGVIRFETEQMAGSESPMLD